jgi:hypothetical protein
MLELLISENVEITKQLIKMKDEYDFSKGERGKYAKQYAEGTNVILLDPDVAKAFPTSESVNKALRALIQQQEDAEPKHN